MSHRHFENNFQDYDGAELMESSEQMKVKIRESLKSKAVELLNVLEKKYKPDWSDFSVYTGSAGLALTYLKAYERLPNDDGKKKEYLSKSLHYANKSIENLRGSEVTFLCGNAGPLAVASVVYHYAGFNDKSKECIKSLLSLSDTALTKQSLPNELLYGRAGYLYSLLFVEEHLGHGSIDPKLFTKVNRLADVILENGKRFSQTHHFQCPLMYEWYHTLYLGAAHGVTGILYLLLKLKDRNLLPAHWHGDIIQTVDYLMSLRFKSGNYPAAIEDNSVDELVHWCHGAPGWLFMFAAAYQSFKDPKYLKAAEGCADVIWQRGLLKKGYGLCHGVAGNAYCFVTMFNLSNDEKYLHRALKFAEFIFDYGNHGCRIADTPYSLFEGMAGTIYFLIDAMHPRHAKFPAFEL